MVAMFFWNNNDAQGKQCCAFKHYLIIRQYTEVKLGVGDIPVDMINQ